MEEVSKQVRGENQTDDRGLVMLFLLGILIGVALVLYAIGFRLITVPCS
jgi:hypothetical protein